MVPGYGKLLQEQRHYGFSGGSILEGRSIDLHIGGSSGRLSIHRNLKRVNTPTAYLLGRTKETSSTGRSGAEERNTSVAGDNANCREEVL